MFRLFLFLKVWYKNGMKQVYLDNAATTVLAPEVLEAMSPYLKEDYGNASSIHQFGQKARRAIDKAREQLAEFLNCQPPEIIFTGSATEADNMVILGVKAKHIITSQIEHPAALEPCKYLEKQGVKITYLAVDKEGTVKASDVEKAITAETGLVSIMYANNEIGAVQPIAEIGKMISRVNQNRENRIFFHTDAVQAVNYLNCDVEKLAVDLLTLSGHKIYGPKGIGALYVKSGVALKPLLYGGHQELGLRPGTENVAGIAGLGKAIEEVVKHKNGISRIKQLRDKLIDGILEKIPQSRLNGSRENRLPNNVNVSFAGAEGEAILIALNQEGIAVSTGSACSSGSLEPSYVLLALGLSHLEAHGSLRLTLGRYTTEQEVDRVLEVLPKVIARLRKISGTI